MQDHSGAYATAEVVMCYLVSVGCMLTALLVWPLTVGAQTTELGLTGEPSLDKPPPASRATGVPVSPRVRKRTQRQWDPIVYQVSATPKQPPPRHPGLAAGIGLGVSVVSFVGGLAMVGMAVPETMCILEHPCTEPAWVRPLIATGTILTIGGLAGLIGSSIALARSGDQWSNSKGKSRRLARRVHWQPETSHFVS